MFLVVYSSTIAQGYVLASEVFRTLALWVAVIALALAWAQLLAALLDTVENVTFLKMLRRPAVRDPWPRVSRCSALSKFAIAGAGSLNMLVGACICIAPINK